MGRIHSIETLGTLDGPGLRMVVFLQGCPLRCRFCHNPDTWNPNGGEEMSAKEIVEKAKQYKRFYGREGGVTFSGGEPLLQAEFVKTCIDELHQEGISSAVDTSGGLYSEMTEAVLDAADLILLDIKHADAEGFRALTGSSQEPLNRTLAHLRKTGKPVWIRQVILRGFTQDEAQIRALRTKIAGIHATKIEFLPYHTLGVHKWTALGIPYSLEGVQPPSEAEMAALRAAFAQ